MSGNYSETEVNTGFTWIDGSKIYKKTINIGALPNSGTKNVAHGISNLKQVIKLEGFTTDGNATYAMPRLMLTSANGVQTQVKGANIQLDTGANLSSYTTTYITLYYTKN